MWIASFMGGLGGNQRVTLGIYSILVSIHWMIQTASYCDKAVC